MYTMGFYSAIKNNEVMMIASKWLKLENIMLSEVNQAHTHTHTCAHCDREKKLVLVSLFEWSTRYGRWEIEKNNALYSKLLNTREAWL
jgi:hypothetical protein